MRANLSARRKRKKCVRPPPLKPDHHHHHRLQLELAEMRGWSWRGWSCCGCSWSCSWHWELGQLSSCCCCCFWHTKLTQRAAATSATARRCTPTRPGRRCDAGFLPRRIEWQRLWHKWKLSMFMACMSRRESSHKRRERDRVRDWATEWRANARLVACLIHTRGAPRIGFRPDRTSLMAHEISPKISANLRLAKVANVATFDEHTGGAVGEGCGKWWQVDLLKKKFTFLWLFTFSNTRSSSAKRQRRSRCRSRGFDKTATATASLPTLGHSRLLLALTPTQTIECNSHLQWAPKKILLMKVGTLLFSGRLVPLLLLLFFGRFSIRFFFVFGVFLFCDLWQATWKMTRKMPRLAVCSFAFLLQATPSAAFG